MTSGSLPRLPAGPPAPRARVLIVDDSVELVASLRAVLMAAEWSDGSAAADVIDVVTASRGDEGLATARSRGFEVAIVDVKLPDTSGVDLIARLREACPLGEVILITGFATMDAAIGALRSGAFAFVPKSFRPEELVSTVEQALAKVRLARERRVLEKRAADAEALSAMGRLALNLAHEIRNPLNAAVLQLHLLGRHVDKLPVDEDSRAALRRKAQIVGDEIGRLNRLLTEFLELARPRGVVRELVHLGRLVDGVLDLEQGAAAARGVAVERDLERDCVLVGDAEKLKQVVLNLVMNSLEAMKDGGVLRVRTGYDGDRVRLAVEDTGTGIEPSALAQVFDPFFTTKEAGTGLGLSIVRKIVDQHGGEIAVESERGTGTRAVVLLPRGR